MKKRIIVGIVSVLLLATSLILVSSNNDKKRESSRRHKVVEKEPNIFVPEGEDEEQAKEIAVDEFDLQQKQKDVQSLLSRGAEFCARNSLTKICHSFTHTKSFVEGELYLFLLDTKGVVYAYGEREDLLWK